MRIRLKPSIRKARKFRKEYAGPKGPGFSDIEVAVDQNKVQIDFEGNENFKDSELRGQLTLVQATGLIARFKGQDILDLRKLQYDLGKNVLAYMRSKGYFQARLGEPEVVGLGVKRTDFIPLITLPLPLLSSKDDTLKIIVPVTEGRIFREGEKLAFRTLITDALEKALSEK